MALHEVAFGLEALETFGARQKFARVGQVLLGELLHLLLDGFEVVGREGLLAVEVVEESVLGGRAVAELGLGKEFEDGGGHEVRGRVAKDFESFGIALGEQAEFDVLVERAREIDKLRLVAVRSRLDLGSECGVGETRADAVRDIEGGGTGGYLFDAAVGQLYMNEFGHEYERPVGSADAAKAELSVYRTPIGGGNYAQRVRRARSSRKSAPMRATDPMVIATGIAICR